MTCNCSVLVSTDVDERVQFCGNVILNEVKNLLSSCKSRSFAGSGRHVRRRQLNCYPAVRGFPEPASPPTEGLQARPQPASLHSPSASIGGLSHPNPSAFIRFYRRSSAFFPERSLNPAFRERRTMWYSRLAGLLSALRNPSASGGRHR